MERASGFDSMMLSIAGPCLSLSISSIYREYFSTREWAVNAPEFIPSCRLEIVISSSSNGLISGGGTEDATSRAAPERDQSDQSCGCTAKQSVFEERAAAGGNPHNFSAHGRKGPLSHSSQVATEHTNSYGPKSAEPTVAKIEAEG